MGIFERIFGREVETKSAPDRAMDNVLRDLIAASETSSGEAVSYRTALRTSTVLACTRVISEGLAQVPAKLYRTDPRMGRVEAVDHPLYDVLATAYNVAQTSFEAREQQGVHAVLTGNAFCHISRNSRDQVIELWPYQPDEITVARNVDRTITYRHGSRGKIDDGAMWHLRGPSWDGIVGMDAVALAREAIGLGMAQEKYGAKLFRNGARPGGILSTEAQLTPDQLKALAELWHAQQGGTDNAHRTAILGGGLEYTSIASTADEAQWTESRRYQVEEICRAFRVLPIMVMQSGATSYNSVEQLFLAHLTHTLTPWHTRFEQSANLALLSREERAAGYYVKLNSNAMLRGSTGERTAYYDKMISLGVVSVNEVRAREDMHRLDDPTADFPRAAANLFGPTPTTEPTKNEGVSV